MKCGILQPSYLPWRGCFHQIRMADVFVFYDDVQYDKHGWRNRNRIQTPNGPRWLTIPVHAKGNVTEAVQIRDVKIDWSSNWPRKHWNAIQFNYAKAPYFTRYRPDIENMLSRRDELLAELTIETTIELARLLGISDTRFVRSSELGITGVKTDRLLKILQHLGATHYIAGASSRCYLDEQALTDAGITFEYAPSRYPEYPQLYEPADPYLSAIDTLFMLGDGAGDTMWGEEARGPYGP